MQQKETLILFIKNRHLAILLSFCLYSSITNSSTNSKPIYILEFEMGFCVQKYMYEEWGRRTGFEFVCGLMNVH
jgi:hypothetical protein